MNDKWKTILRVIGWVVLSPVLVPVLLALFIVFLIVFAVLCIGWVLGDDGIFDSKPQNPIM